MALKIVANVDSRYLLVDADETPSGDNTDPQTPARVLDAERGILYPTEWIGSILKRSPHFDETEPDPELLDRLLDADLDVRGAPKGELGTPRQNRGRDQGGANAEERAQ